MKAHSLAFNQYEHNVLHSFAVLHGLGPHVGSNHMELNASVHILCYHIPDPRNHLRPSGEGLTHKQKPLPVWCCYQKRTNLVWPVSRDLA